MWLGCVQTGVECCSCDMTVSHNEEWRLDSAASRDSCPAGDSNEVPVKTRGPRNMAVLRVLGDLKDYCSFSQTVRYGMEGVEEDSVACKMTRRRLERESVIKHLH